ncbi:MAG: hypothetical protein INH40_10155 [Acidobacteriaceae bacterium]|nr:hypothetical protein [Acidobacteriaceae bacterium]
MTNSIWEPRSSAPWLSSSRLPPLAGAPIAFSFTDRLSVRGVEMDAAAFLRERRVVLARHLRGRELRRVTVHELFHFVWWRLGNPPRRSWEALLRAERSRGEAGWSAEWRKAALSEADRRDRTRRWREYACEAFCDSAAALWASPAQCTLAPRWLAARRAWFQATLGHRPLSI